MTVSLWTFVILPDWSVHSSFEIFRIYVSLRTFRLCYSTRTSLNMISKIQRIFLAEVYCYGCKTSWIAILRVLPPTLESVLQQIRLQNYFSRMVNRATSLFNSCCSKVANSTNFTFFCPFYRTLKTESTRVRARNLAPEVVTFSPFRSHVTLCFLWWWTLHHFLSRFF